MSEFYVGQRVVFLCDGVMRGTIVGKHDYQSGNHVWKVKVDRPGGDWARFGMEWEEDIRPLNVLERLTEEI